jgi:hypothetical protein
MTSTPETTIIPEIIDEPNKAGCFNDLETIGYLAAEISRLRGKLNELERERDEAIRSCHTWQKGHAELVTERDYLISLLEGQQFFADTKSTKPERKHIGRWGHNKEEFTSPYINK